MIVVNRNLGTGLRRKQW